jgi:hypothetical protein
VEHQRGSIHSFFQKWILVLSFFIGIPFPSLLHSQDLLDELPYEGHYVPALFFGVGIDWDGLWGCEGFYEFARGWQAGAILRIHSNGNLFDYDGLPQGGAHLRYARLSPEESASLTNSDYLDLGLEAYAAYDNGGRKVGAAPLIRLQAGKYWTPIEGMPLALELFLVLGRHLGGHPSHSNKPDVLAAGLNLLWTKSWVAKPLQKRSRF